MSTRSAFSGHFRCNVYKHETAKFHLGTVYKPCLLFSLGIEQSYRRSIASRQDDGPAGIVWAHDQVRRTRKTRVTNPMTRRPNQSDMHTYVTETCICTSQSVTVPLPLLVVRPNVRPMSMATTIFRLGSASACARPVPRPHVNNALPANSWRFADARPDDRRRWRASISKVSDKKLAKQRRRRRWRGRRWWGRRQAGLAGVGDLGTPDYDDRIFCGRGDSG